VLGDTILLLEARLGAGLIQARLERSKLAGRVRQAEQALSQNSFNAIVTGRLIPGGRTPVIAAWDCPVTRYADSCPPESWPAGFGRASTPRSALSVAR
jgi:hypothetical protein